MQLIRVSILILALAILFAGSVSAQVPQMVPNRPDWWRNGASLDMDFYHNRYMVSLTAPIEYTSLTQFIAAVSGTFTRPGANETATGEPFYLASNQAFVSRASTGTYFDNTGTMQTAATNTARPDHDPATYAYKGLLVEPARTNVISNSTMQGAAPGVWPTGWVSGGYGVTATVVATGTIAGINYIDVHFQGTGDTVSRSFSQRYTNIYAGGNVFTSANISWTNAMYVGYVSGSYPTGTWPSCIMTAFRDTPTGYIGELRGCSPSSSGYVKGYVGGLKRFIISGVTSPLTSYLTLYFQLNYDQGEEVDLTLRFAAPQLEQGNTATSFIPTTSAPATRAADVYTSAYSGTYFDASGTLRAAPANTPRLDHDPSTGEPRGVLIEEARTNVLLNSTNILASSWIRYCNTPYSTAALDPMGGMDAIKVPAGFDGCGGTASGILQYYNGNSGTTAISGTYTLSIWGKTESGSLPLYIGTDDTNYGPTPACTLTTSWQRCTVTRTKTITGSPLDNRIFEAIEATPSNTAYYLFGPQAERASFPTSYIPTAGSAVTRPADVFGIDGSGWVNPSVGSIYIKGTINSPPVDGSFWPGLFFLSDNGSPDNAAQQYITNGGSSWLHQVIVNGATYSILVPYTLGSELTSMISYEAGDLGGAANGTAFASGDPPSIPVFNRLDIGRSRGHRATGYIKRFTYFPTRQPDYSLPDYTR